MAIIGARIQSGLVKWADAAVGRCWWWLTIVWLAAGQPLVPVYSAELASQGTPRCIVVEVYLRAGERDSEGLLSLIETLRRDREGLVIAQRDISTSAQNRERLVRVARHFRVSDTKTPLVYACNRVISGFRSADEFVPEWQQMLRMDVFVRHGCQRCAKAKQFLPQFLQRYPGLELRYRDVRYDGQALAAMNQLVAKHRAGAVSVPVFHFCDRLLVGFSSASFTGRRLDEALNRWTTPCKPMSPSSAALPGRYSTTRVVSADPPRWRGVNTPITLLVAQPGRISRVVFTPEPESATIESRDEHLEDELALPLPPAPLVDESPGDLPLPDPALPTDVGDRVACPAVELPFFGELSVSQVGLPSLTLAIGLVDGFNPCAMWVLLFLLSLLVNLKDRWRILAIAGTFILISGLAYFAFMAAWLNVFLFVGYLRPIQIVLGVTAIAVGSVHIKDFFAFHQGLTLSIPEAAKPGIYARTRQIITAENLSGALLAATVLAVMVNVVELLCTAGLPALYTEILAMQNLPAWQNYAYLALYNAAYMFDDTLMVGIVVITLSKQKLQENQGRWLKLVSGVVIAALGIVMIVRPDLLV